MNKDNIKPKDKIGFWTIIKEDKRDKQGRKRYLCICHCGKTKSIDSYSLRCGDTKSCGCKMITHNKSRTKEYYCWQQIKKRCLNKKDYKYIDYGGRGITVCKRWRNSFEHFLIDMGMAPSSKHQIDRINNNKGYSPQNCRWTTSKINTQNRRGSYYWYINNIKYNSITEAALANKVGKTTIIRWCNNNKNNAYREKKYK